jgi:hypothetical protein
MKRQASGSWFLVAICTLSLAGYLFYSAGLRYWLSSWDYFLSLYHGLSMQPDPIWRQLLRRMSQGVPWEARQLAMLAGLLSLSFLVALLAWRNLKGRLNLALAAALFVPACLIVPQILLALLLWPDGRGRVTYGNHMILLGLAALGLWLYARLRPSVRPDRQPDERDRIGFWGLAFLAPAVLIAVTALALGIGNDPGYDAGAYHLPLAAGYQKDASIAVHWDIPFTYPSNGELVLRWFLFPGNDRLAGLPDFLALLLVGVALYQLCRSLGINRQAALIASCSTITFPVLTHLSIIPNPDLIGVAPMLLALVFLLDLHRTRCADPLYFGLFGLAAGLGAGARLSLLPVCAFLAGGLLFVMIRSERCHLVPDEFRLDWRWISRSFLIAGMCAFFGGGFWYLRNALIHGNPVFPVSVLGLPGMPLDAISPVIGVMSEKPWLILFYPWAETGYTYIYDTGVGAVFTAIVLPGLIWWPFAFYRDRKNPAGGFRAERLLVYLCIVFCMAYFVSRPSVYTRHAAFGILLSFFLVAEMWQHLRSRTIRAAVFLSFLVMFFPLEKSLAGSLLYRLAMPEREGAARFRLPPEIDTLPPARIFNAAQGNLNYGLMGRDYRHQVMTRFRVIQPREVREFRAEYVLIREEQKAEYTRALNLELVAAAAAAEPKDALLLYRILPP